MPTAELQQDRLALVLRELAGISASIATFCDRTEHNEAPDRDAVLVAAKRLRELTVFVAEELRLDLVSLYIDRIGTVERRSALKDHVVQAESTELSSWEELRLYQLSHDRRYHPDVFGLSKRDQLIHFSLHLSKLVGRVAAISHFDLEAWADFASRTLPDMLIFGVKLSTVLNENLTSEGVVHAAPKRTSTYHLAG